MSLIKFTLCAAVLSTLAACGGGGGSSDTGPTPPPPPPGGGTNPPPVILVPDSGTLNLVVEANPYAPDSVAAQAFDTLNAVRLASGAGALKHSPQLTVAAQAHADYLTAYGGAHEEDPANADKFYGVTHEDRIKRAGFRAIPWSATETISGTGPDHHGSGCLSGLPHFPYHGAAMLSPTTYAGIGIGFDGFAPTCVVDYAAKQGESEHGQVAPAGSLIVFPYPGMKDVVLDVDLTKERPHVPPELTPNGKTGATILVGYHNADSVNAATRRNLAPILTKAELRDPAGNLVPLNGILTDGGIRVATGDKPVMDMGLTPRFLAMIPTSALAGSTTYTASVEIQMYEGGPVSSKTWSFTTGEAPPPPPPPLTPL